MKRVVILIAIILLASFVNASFILHNSSVDRTYGTKEDIRGIVNISFQSEPATNKLKSNFLGEINLINFLDANSVDYTCNPISCNSGWISSNAATNKSFTLNSGNEKIVAIILNGNFKDITSLNFNITINNSETCQSPAEIDFLDNGVDWKSNKTGADFFCTIGQGRGCFDSTASLDDVYLGVTPYCEKIKLNAGSKFQLGAWIKKSGSWSSELLKMELYSKDDELLESCNLPQPSDTGGEVYCTVSYSNPDIQDFYVCTRATQTTTYQIKTESSGEKCGFYSIPGEQLEYHDYWIFAKSARFIDIGKFNFNQQEYERLNSGDLLSDVKDYISQEYSNNCSPCVLPIKIKANYDLAVKLENLNVKYSTYSGDKSEDRFYDVVGEPAKISSNQLILDLALAGIKTPVNYGNYDFYLYLNSNQILMKPILVVNTARIDKIYPTIQYASVNGKISADVVSPRNISSYSWDFGDGESEETQVNSVSHKYAEVGSYTLVLEVKDISGIKTSKSILISVVSPATKINSTIQDYKQRLNNLTTQLVNIGWYKDEIEGMLEVDDKISELNGLEIDYNAASADEDYVIIMEKLNEMSVPRTIKKASGTIPVYLSPDKIDSEAVTQAIDECGEACKKAIAAWTQSHLTLTLNFEKVQAYYDENVETLINAYRISIVPDESQDKEFYVFVKDAKFNGLDAKDAANYQVVSFEDISSRTVEFTSALDIEELAIFLSPELSLVNIGEEIICNQNDVCDGDENWKNCREDCKPWGWVITLLIILLVVAFGVYLLLQWWYKEKYESALFKDRHDIYNLMNFISNGKSQGLSNKDIASKLKERGWKGEQISYVFKKFEGKAIMPLDFVKLFKKDGISKPKIN